MCEHSGQQQEQAPFNSIHLPCLLHACVCVSGTMTNTFCQVQLAGAQGKHWCTCHWPEELIRRHLCALLLSPSAGLGPAQ